MNQQLKTPNLDPVIYQGGRVLTDWLGYCLAYVQTAFGTGWAGSTAWESWTTKTKYPHPDKLIPKGVYVPLWFSHFGTYGGVYKNWGHVAIQAPDGRIWSSPLSHKPTADVFGSIEEIERRFNCTFQGWSEDIAGTKVIELIAQGDETMPIRSDEFIKNMYRYVGGREATAQEINIHRAGTPESLLNGFIQGGDLEVNRLRKAITDLQVALKNEQSKPPKEVVKEVEKIVEKVVEVEVIKEVTHNVEVPLTWKTVLPWILSQFRGLKK